MTEMTETTESTTEPRALLRRKAFRERLMAEAGIKAGPASKIGDAALKVLGDAIAAGEDVLLPPLGKLRVMRSIDKDGATVTILRFRRADAKEVEAEAETDATEA